MKDIAEKKLGSEDTQNKNNPSDGVNSQTHQNEDGSVKNGSVRKEKDNG